MKNAAIIGFGGIARVHAASYAELEKIGKVRLCAVFDTNENAFSKKTEININSSDDNKITYNCYTDLEKMLTSEEIDIIDICLPTFLHKEMTIKMLKRGYHVICEKPMATTYEDCMEMLEAAKNAGKRLMIGQCLHFFPEYEYLKDTLDSGIYGKAKSAFFQRLSSPPLWGWNEWHTKKQMFGSCLADLSIHDIDMTQYLFGPPKKVFCSAKDGFGSMDGVTSLLMYEDFTSTIIADWSIVNGIFSSEYRVCFEKATVIDKDGVVTVYPHDGQPFTPKLSTANGYTSEISHFIDLTEGAKDGKKNHVRSAAETIRIINLLTECAENGGRIMQYSQDND